MDDKNFIIKIMVLNSKDLNIVKSFFDHDKYEVRKWYLHNGRESTEEVFYPLIGFTYIINKR